MSNRVSQKTIDIIRVAIKDHPNYSRWQLAEYCNYSKATIDAAIRIGNLSFTGPRGRGGKKSLPDGHLSVAQVLNLCREAGMTYGKYVQLHPDI